MNLNNDTKPSPSAGRLPDRLATLIDRIAWRLFNWLLMPVGMVAACLRTDYWLDGRTLLVTRPFRRRVSVRIDELDEIGVETTDQGPFVEDVFWILKRGEMRIRIGDPHPVFKMLMDR